MLERLTRAVIRWRIVVVTGWIIVVVIGSLATLRVPALLTTSTDVPGSASSTANAIISRHFGENVEGTFSVVVTVPSATTQVQSRIRRQLVVASRAVPTGSVTAVQGAFGVVYASIGTRLDLERAASHTDALRRALRAAGVTAALVTGPPALERDVSPILQEDLRVGEAVAVGLALLILLFVLGRTRLVAAPLCVAIATTAGSLLVVYVLAHLVVMVLYVPNVVALIGLGLAVDYSLLIVQRFREERAVYSSSIDDAIVQTMRTAGHTVVVSALAVALGLSALLFIPVPFVRSLGFAGLVVPFVSIAAALTLQPALLAVLSGRAAPTEARRAGRPGSRLWRGVATAVLRRPGAVLAGSSVVLVLAALPVLWLQLTPGSVGSIPAGLESARGAAVLSSRLGAGVPTPIQIVVDTGERGAAGSQRYKAAIDRLATTLLANPEVFAVAVGTRAPYVDASGRFDRVLVVGRHPFGDEATQRLVGTLGPAVVAARFPKGAAIAVGGVPGQGVAFLDAVYGAFPWVVAFVLVLAFLFLLMALRSLALAALAVVLDVCTLAATYGIVVWVFRFGVGADVFGLYRADQLEGWVPVFLFTMLFGLSMDYQVFLVMRMREARDHGADTRTAITDGLVHTGRVVSAAAVIFVCAVIGLVAGRVAGLQELGVGLAVGVVLDAFLVRGMLLPSVMALVGDRVWWGPRALSPRRDAAPA